MNVNLVQYYKNANGWELETLSDDEMQEVYKVVRERNKEIFEECMRDAFSIVGKYQTTYSCNLEVTARVAQQLFERRAIHISVILDAVLKRKVFDLRRNGAHTDNQYNE
jgi:hypothetical protein